MTPDPKLPPLAEVLREKMAQQHRIAGVAKSVGDRLEIEIVAASRALIYADLADALDPYDALIRQQEARIAEQDLRVAVLQESLRNLEDDIEGLEKENARLAEERETFRTAFSVANDQMEHTTSLFLPVEAEKDRLAKKVAELEGELADANDELSHWRRLAVAARDALGRSGGLCGMEREQLTASQIIDRLAEMPATEVELAMTSLGVARQNREDLAEFRELAREAHEMSGISNTALNKLVLVPDLALRISYRLAARHKEE